MERDAFDIVYEGFSKWMRNQGYQRWDTKVGMWYWTVFLAQLNEIVKEKK